jgi:radical SAM superfamily enzyme YgiQ (UPF0313 family)
MRYKGPVFRPPSEATSYILQVVYGCSWNKCTFCYMYPGVKFHLRPMDEVRADIIDAAQVMPTQRRVFLADGDAMVLGERRLLEILELLHEHFPKLERVGIYTDAKGILRKSDATLKRLREAGIGIVYMGLESGSERVLRRLHKEASAVEMTQAIQRARGAGLASSVIALIGAGGRELSDEHADDTAAVVSAMAPDYFSLLTLMILDGTPMSAQLADGTYEPLTPIGTLEEMRRIVRGLELDEPCVFRTNHASTYLPLSGTLPLDKPRLLERLDWAIENKVLRPEAFRAL